MAIKTTLEQLEEVQAAISALMTEGQSATIDGNTVEMANLPAMERREQTLLARYRTEQGTGGPVVVHQVPRRDY